MAKTTSGTYPPNVFICHASEDLNSAQRLYNDLEKFGLNSWFSESSIRGGQNRKVAISKAIRKSRYFLALFSKASVRKRGYFQKEIKEAFEVLEEFPESEIFIIPIRLDKCTIDYQALRDIQWIDMFPSWSEGLDKILLSIYPKHLPLENKNLNPHRNLEKIKLTPGERRYVSILFIDFRRLRPFC